MHMHMHKINHKKGKSVVIYTNIEKSRVSFFLLKDYYFYQYFYSAKVH